MKLHLCPYGCCPCCSRLLFQLRPQCELDTEIRSSTADTLHGHASSKQLLWLVAPFLRKSSCWWHPSLPSGHPLPPRLQLQRGRCSSKQLHSPAPTLVLIMDTISCISAAAASRQSLEDIVLLLHSAGERNRFTAHTSLLPEGFEHQSACCIHLSTF